MKRSINISKYLYTKNIDVDFKFLMEDLQRGAHTAGYIPLLFVEHYILV